MQLVVSERHAELVRVSGKPDDVLRADVRSEYGRSDHEPANMTAGQEIVFRIVLSAPDDPRRDGQKQREVCGENDPVEGGEVHAQQVLNERLLTAYCRPRLQQVPKTRNIRARKAHVDAFADSEAV